MNVVVAGRRTRLLEPQTSSISLVSQCSVLSLVSRPREVIYPSLLIV